MSNLAKYEEWRPEVAVGEAEAAQQAAESGSYWKPKGGTNIVRVLPTRKGAHPSPIVVTWQHFIELPEQENPVAFLCPRKMKAGWACPACMRVEELRASGTAADYELAGEYLAKMRCFCNIIDRADKEAGPQTYAFGKTVYEPLMAYRSRNPRDDEPFTNVDDTGCDVALKKTGEKKNSKYTVRLVREHTSLSEDANVVAEWLAAMRDLRSEMRVLKTSEIVAKLEGEQEPRGSRSQGRAAPARGRGRARTVEDDMVDDGRSIEVNPDDV